jgi:hypothetical protein
MQRPPSLAGTVSPLPPLRGKAQAYAGLDILKLDRFVQGRGSGNHKRDDSRNAVRIGHLLIRP